MIAIAWFLFSIGVIALELYTGCAIVGWTGDNMVVQRHTSPGPYWFAVFLHVLVGIVFPLLLVYRFGVA
jgi:hypothetical protein